MYNDLQNEIVRILKKFSGGATILEVRAAIFIENDINTGQALLRLLYAKKLTCTEFKNDEPVFKEVK